MIFCYLHGLYLYIGDYCKILVSVLSIDWIHKKTVFYPFCRRLRYEFAWPKDCMATASGHNDADGCRGADVRIKGTVAVTTTEVEVS
jgi:hypothetical protein